MALYLLGLVLFFGIHSVAIFNPAWREGAVARLGRLPWMAIYSVIAFIGLVLMIRGYGLVNQAPTLLYTPPHWLTYPALVLLVFVFPLLIAAYLPGRIQRATRHPMLVATKTWALAHLLVNGTLAAVMLFGVFLVWAVADRISLKHRQEPPVPRLPTSSWNDAIAVVGGLALYAAFVLGLHQWLFGVSPLG